MPSKLHDPSKLCVHTATTRPLTIEQVMEKYPAAGITNVTVWRDALEGRDARHVGQQLKSAGMKVVSLCRGGFFPATSKAARQHAIDDNLLAIDQAAALGAPIVVLVCGAVPGQPLTESRVQITEGIEACLSHAESCNVVLAIEPLHPMYADDRSAINTLEQANEVCDRLDTPSLGIAVDVYHVWWDPDLEKQIALTGKKNRLLAFHICDWLTPTADLLEDRGLMGEGCIDIPKIRALVEAAGFTGPHEVEIFSRRWWNHDQDDYLHKITQAYLDHS